MKNFVSIVFALCASVSFGYQSPLASYLDYLFSRPVNTNRIEGRIMGPGGDYSVMRTEDVAFIYEANLERNAITTGSYDGFSVTNVSAVGLRSGTFPLEYTNLYPWAIYDQSAVRAYYDTNVVTNVTARLGIDTLWPERLSLDSYSGWVDKDERWPTEVEDATVRGSGDAAYTNLPIKVVRPEYANPQAVTNPPPSSTAVVHFVVWPTQRSVVEAYKYLAKTEKCVKGVRSAGQRPPINVITDTKTQGEVLVLKYNEDSLSVESFPASDLAPSGETTNALSTAVSGDAFDTDSVARYTGVGKRWSWGVDKAFGQAYDVSYNEETEMFTWSESSKGSAVATYMFEKTTEDKRIVLDLGISKDVATTGVDRVKSVEVYWDGSIRVARGCNGLVGLGHLERFGGMGNIPPRNLYDGFKDTYVVIPQTEQVTMVDVPHTNRVWNAKDKVYETSVTYTVGVEVTSDTDGWAAQALRVAGYDGYGSLVQTLAGKVPDPDSSPRTPDPTQHWDDPEGFISGTDYTEANVNARFDIIFTAYPHRAVVTCKLKTEIRDGSEEEEEDSPD